MYEVQDPQGGSNLGFRVDFLSVLRHLEGARDIMPGAAVSAACGLPSPRTDLETDVGASPHAKPPGTKRRAAVVTPSPTPKRSKGSHGSPVVLVVLATAAWRRQCAQCAPSCSPQSPYAHAIGPSYQNCCGEKACNREKAQP